MTWFYNYLFNWFILCLLDALGDRKLSVFLQDPREKHSINATIVAGGWARATGVGYELL